MSYGGGGSGSGSISGSSDVALNSPANNQVLTYNTTLGKWQNQVTNSYAATRVPFSSLTGASDDAKLAAFISTYSGQTYKPVLELDELRAYTFTVQQQIYSGFKMVGGGYAPLDQNRSSNVLPQVVKLRLTGNNGWLTLPNGTIFGVSLVSISFDVNSTSRVFHPNASCVMWTSTFRDIAFQNGLSFMGSSTTAQPQDTCVFSGFWNVNNVCDTFINVAGSDSRFNPDQLLLDSSSNTFMADTAFLATLTSVNTTNITNWYVTADRHSAFNISGGASALPMRLSGCDIQGRNATTPCFGALMRIGSDMIIRDTEFAYAMSNPSATGRNDAGVLHITAGNVLVDGCSYKLASGVANTVPFIYIASGFLRVRNIMTDGTFTPVVRQASSGLIDADNSVTVITG